MKTIFAVFIFGLIILAIVVMVIINFTYKGVKKIKEEVAENYYRNQKRKEMKEKNPFGDDYFKSTNTSKSNTKSKPKTSKAERQQPEKEKTARSTTTTSSGVTIIDDRDVEEKRKIFDHSDGEYVEFEEV